MADASISARPVHIAGPCPYCDQPLPRRLNQHRKYCGAACRQRYHALGRVRAAVPVPAASQRDRIATSDRGGYR